MTQPVPDTSSFRQAVSGDVDVCWLALKKEDTQANRRAYTRAAFAAVEAFVSVLKAQVIAEIEAGRYVATRAEAAALYEEAYDLTEEGVARARQSFLGLRNNLRFAVDVFCRAHGVSVRPDYSTEGWKQFRRAMEVRNRITHPKIRTDIDLSDDELNDVDRAFFWFLNASTSLYVEGRAYLISRLPAPGSEAPDAAV